MAALRAIYTRAVADNLIPPHLDPAARDRKPRRPATNRRALTSGELPAINHAAACSGDDVALDSLLLRLHSETACRRGAAILLRQNDLDETWCLVRLREKNNNTRWQPASPTSVRALAAHRDHCRTGVPDESDEPLLRYKSGVPLTTRRYDHLWTRLGAELPWVAAQGITTHWLHHTTITWVERHFGYGVARAGHTDTTGAVTTTYIRGQPHEIAQALSTLTGETNPYLQQ